MNRGFIIAGILCPALSFGQPEDIRKHEVVPAPPDITVVGTTKKKGSNKVTVNKIAALFTGVALNQLALSDRYNISQSWLQTLFVNILSHSEILLNLLPANRGKEIFNDAFLDEEIFNKDCLDEEEEIFIEAFK